MQSIDGSWQFLQGLLRSSSYVNGTSEQNFPVMNQTAADTEQRQSGQPQPADISSAESHSRRNTHEFTAAIRLARKRKNDRAYRTRVKERQKQMKSTLEILEAEIRLLKSEKETQSQELDELRNSFDELHQKFITQRENEQQMKLNLETLEVENGILKSEKEFLKEENVLVNKRFETQSKELDELNQKFIKQLERKGELKFNLKTVEAENGRLKDAIIGSLKEDNVLVNQTLSNELGQLRSKLENLENKLASTKTCGNRQSIAGSSTNLIGGFGQYWPVNEETEGSMQSSQATMLPSFLAFPNGESRLAIAANYNEGTPELELPGFRFLPTEEELLGFYLKNKIFGKSLPFDVIGSLNIYNYDPWDLSGLSRIGENEWYFFVSRDRKHDRTTENGFWQLTGVPQEIFSLSDSKCVIGLKKTLVFYKGRAPRGTETDWIMSEYCLLNACPLPKEIVLCKIYREATSLRVVEQRSALEEVMYGCTHSLHLHHT